MANDRNDIDTLIDSLLQASSRLSYQRALWKAEREGQDQDLSVLEQVAGSDPKSVWNAMQFVREERRRRDIAVREYNASVRSLQRSMWKAERMGDVESLKELEGAIGADPKTVWNTLQNVKEQQHRREALYSPSFTGIRRLKIEASRFENIQDRKDFIESFGYSKTDTEQIVKGTDKIRSLVRKRNAELKYAEVAENVDLANFASFARDLNEQASPFDRSDSLKKIAALDRARRRGQISDSQYNKLSSMYGSYEDLSNAMDNVIDKNGKLLSVYRAIGNIPMYNFERLEQAFKGEVSGIKGAARGVIPSILYDPLSRITDAGMNGLNAYLANIKAGVRATGAIGSGLMGTGMGMLGMGNPVGLGFMIGGGVLKAGTQIWGNAKEAQITRWGENIQNNLNTLGFLQDMILMPFRLLGNALKLATRGLTAFTSGLRFVSNLMSGGLTGLQQMGNPLTGLTGVGYGSYMGSLSADAASLLGAGTLNSVYNDFAAQRMALYTTGKLDTNRLVAASMLGVFNEAYGYTMNEEGSFGNMIDKILASTAGMSDLEKKRTFALANNINPNLGAVLQTMDTLGISTYAGLQRPGGMWGYSQGAYDSFRPGWQRAQWEYQYAGTQWDTTKRRLATSIWNAGGKTIYNAFNETMAAVASGDWEAVGEKIKFIWTTIKEGANSVWDAISETFGLGGKSLSQVIWGGLAKGLTVLRDNILPIFNNIWDSIIDVMIDKFSNFISYLGTIRLDFGELVKAIQGKKHGDILTYLGDTTAMGTWGGIQQQAVPELDRLAQVATAFDVKYGRKFLSAGGYWGPGFGSKHVIEEGGLLGADAYVYDNVIRGFQDWAKRTGELTPDQLADLNSMLADAGFGYAFTGSGDEAFLDFLAQSGQNAAGAAFLHGQWSTESAKRGSVPYRLATELNAIRKKGQDVVGSPILNSLIDYANSKATLDITVNGKGVASMSVAADGSMALTGSSNNSLVNVVSSDGSARYVIESMAQIQR